MAEGPISEQIFECFCKSMGLSFERIPEEKKARTPDYLLKVGTIEIVVEVKEYGLNREEEESYRCLKETGFAMTEGGEVGKKVRKKIGKSGGQIRARTEGKRPGMLVLLDPTGMGNFMPEDIKAAMHGAFTVRVTIPRRYDPSRPRSARLTHGGGRRMTESDNTSISAVALLWVNGPADVHLYVYHNVHAVVPIEPGILAPYASGQQTYVRDDGWKAVPTGHTTSDGARNEPKVGVVRSTGPFYFEDMLSNAAPL